MQGVAVEVRRAGACRVARCAAEGEDLQLAGLAREPDEVEDGQGAPPGSAGRGTAEEAAPDQAVGRAGEQAGRGAPALGRGDGLAAVRRPHEGAVPRRGERTGRRRAAVRDQAAGLGGELRLGAGGLIAHLALRSLLPMGAEHAWGRVTTLDVSTGEPSSVTTRRDPFCPDCVTRAPAAREWVAL
ncbi:hypothetical protein DCW30_23345 [Streptomyces alfalfae]|uniref:hypothetical protein n=1 Tax=Streptomyces alfalfae TaxID=1642299 RepID=UPI000977CCE9|nr:hypothetical protein D3X13_04405 [Streptomyces fradiae]QUI34961.1 hypothetical protein H9W91_32055 [Streptomyces alfalfae]RXX39054.1 hypothetical protein DCW30_23345 [Streptomyces alfalfae]RZM90830.1 hypothetical protein D4104_24435 [Streptomyces alfalfae]